MGDIEQFFQDSHYNIIRVLLISISGLWPFNTRIRRYAIYLALTLILGSGFIFEILGVIEVRHDFFEIIDSVPMLFFTMLTLSKMLCTVYALPKIKVLVLKMQEYCLSPKSDEETKIQNSHAQYGRKLGYAYTDFLLSQSFLYLLTTLLTRLFYVKSVVTNETSHQKMIIGLPHRVNYMIDLNTYYIPIVIHSALCDFTLTFLLVVCDVLYFIAVEHCCGLFAALRYQLEIAVFKKDKVSTTKDKCYSNIVYSICRYKETMQVSLFLVVQISSSVLVISFLGYQVINNMGNVDLVKPVCFLNAVIINIFLDNWQGQKIIDSSERVFESAYNTEWYNMPIATRKLLIMIMIRSERPLMLKLGKIVALSYATFNTIIRTSSSYFMLLRSL